MSTISSTSLVSSTSGMESSPANFLNSADLPSMTGSDARGPMSPRPSTAVPSLIRPRGGGSRCSGREHLVVGDRPAHLRNTRRVGDREVARPASGTVGAIESLPASCGGEDLLLGEVTAVDGRGAGVGGGAGHAVLLRGWVAVGPGDRCGLLGRAAAVVVGIGRGARSALRTPRRRAGHLGRCGSRPIGCVGVKAEVTLKPPEDFSANRL